ncbi:MAG: hypothetical protein JXL85_09365 [Bacilli bacterium]|nr:hypothetical protein [Bacilli bacterium]
MDAPHIAMFVGIGFMVLQTVLSKIQNPKKEYASQDDRELFQTDSFNRRFAKFGFIIGFTLPLFLGLIFGAAKSMPANVSNGLISIFILAILITVSTGMHYWQLSGISKAEIEYRKFKQNSEPEA